MNTSVTDNLTSVVSTALMSDPQTEDYVIEVINDRGMITLKGEVESPAVRKRAEEIALQQDGVVSVTNSITVK